jgi:hypothetical protein
MGAVKIPAERRMVTAPALLLSFAHTSRTVRRDVVRITMLCLLTAVIWCWHHDRLAWSSWSMPLDYTGDSLEILARIKASSEGDLVPFRPHFVHRLGAPFGANWSEYPGSDDLANYSLGLLARLVGAAAASNCALLLAQITAALAFFLCARLLRHRWEWAFAGALLFSFSFFSLSRGLPHLWLTFTYTVPLALFTCGVIAVGRRAATRPVWRWLCYGTAAALGASNPYNLFLYLQLLAWSVLAQWLRARWSAGVRLGLICGALAVFVFGAIHADLWLNVADEGKTPLLVRNYAGTEIYGLKPIELFLPSSRHHSEWLAAIGSRYVRWSDWRGETFSPYLGLTGAAGLIWLLGALVKALLAARRRRVPGHALPALWILLFSVIGGINSILAFYVGLNIFRASNRYSVFLLALVLMFVVARLSRLTRNWPSAIRLGVAGVVAAFGLWDQIPQAAGKETVQRITERVAADRRLGREMEQRLGRGAMVFQLPILEFPEGLPQLRVNEYDHFRPYLATRTARFSYGESKNRAQGAWQADCLRLTPAALVQALESYGFSALYIDRQGYPDHADQLLAGLAAAGRTEVIDGIDHQQIVVLLHAADQTRPPLARTFTFGQGWNPRPPGESSSEPRWTNGSASLAYFNPLPGPLSVSMGLAASGVDERTLRILVNGREQIRVQVGPVPKEINLPVVEFRAGVNRIDLVSPEPAIRVSEQRWRLRAIGVQRLQLQVLSGSAADRVHLSDDVLSGLDLGPPGSAAGG